MKDLNLLLKNHRRIILIFKDQRFNPNITELLNFN